MEDHTFFLRWHRLHQMPVRYEQLRYHLSELHTHHIQRKMLSYAALQPRLPHTGTVARILCPPVLFPYTLQVLRKHLFLLLQVFQERYQAMHMPYNKLFRLLPLPLHNPLLDLRRVQGWMEVSMVLLSMQEYTHPHL